MKGNHSTFLIMSILVTLFVGAAYVYMYVMINVSLEKTVKVQTMVNSALLAKEREDNFLETYEKTAGKWSKLKEFFVESDKVVDFIESVELLGKQSGSQVTIRAIEADNLDNAPAGKEGTVRLKMNSRGSWQAVMRALSLAEVLPYKVFVNNVQANIMEVSSETTKETTTPKTVWDLSFDLEAAMIAVGSTTPTTK